MEPKRGQIIITEKIPAIGETNLWSAKYLVTKLKPGIQIDSTEEEKRLGLAFALTRTEGDSYLIGSTREFVGYDKGTTMEGIRAIINQAVSFIPVLKDVNFIRAIAGLRPATPDGKMVLGEHAGVPGFFTAAGHEGDGISLAPITGKLLADMVCEGRADSRLAELSPNRFASNAKEVS
jgi:sarcosine oxidase subunit beta